MSDQKTNEKNIERFTLPSSEEKAAAEVKSGNSSSSSNLLFDTNGKNSFWHTKKGKIWTSFFVVLIILALAIELFMYRKGTTQKVSTPVEPTPSEEPQSSPTPTPEKIDISKYKIEILNGSGISGEAAQAETLLQQEGFTVVSIGNASQTDYENTIIRTKKDVPQIFTDKLKNALEKIYILDQAEELSENEENDVTVIIGINRSKNGK